MNHRLRHLWAGSALSLSLIGLLALVSLSSLRSPIMAAGMTPAADVGRVTVEFPDTTISPFDSQLAMPIYITHEVLDLAGVDIWIYLSRPDLIRVLDTMWVRQHINCPDTTCDTTYDTTVVTQLDMEGGILSDWYDPAYARVFSPTSIRYVSIYNPTAGHEPVPPADTARLLCRIPWEPLVPPEVLDTLQDRSVTWLFGICNYADPNGVTIGRRDSVFCVNPPDCDTLDTVWVDDNHTFEGTMTIGPSCTPGDANRDLVVTASDVIHLVNYTFKGGPEPSCGGLSGDTNCSGEINSADVIYLVNYVFKSGLEPCTP